VKRTRRIDDSAGLSADAPARHAVRNSAGMSKQNNVNPGTYDEGDRNHQGEGIVQEDHKRAMKQNETSQRDQGRNFIPGEAPVGEPGKSSKKDEEKSR